MKEYYCNVCKAKAEGNWKSGEPCPICRKGTILWVIKKKGD